MITSIRKAWQDANSGEGRIANPSDEAVLGMTRGDFLRVAAAGALAAGIAGTAGLAQAAPAGKVPPVIDIDKLYDAWQQRMNTGDL